MLPYPIMFSDILGLLKVSNCLDVVARENKAKIPENNNNKRREQEINLPAGG
ncbi:MAG: hypothetical protein RML10_08700 [Geminocystis sp.]|nr:hypothetical protein [Geminocystis sp.]MCX8078283.1 hypothetical protein [Geminocystis sp.]MDW8463649.1 hypothetical protein [Geminocystis sp.]HIK38875.1 hypothetical protein [Geminocystis sp. M7585_C2015_104]